MVETPKQISRRRFSFGELADITMLASAIAGLWSAIAVLIIGLLAKVF